MWLNYLCACVLLNRMDKEFLLSLMVTFSWYWISCIMLCGNFGKGLAKIVPTSNNLFDTMRNAAKGLKHILYSCLLKKNMFKERVSA